MRAARAVAFLVCCATVAVVVGVPALRAQRPLAGEAESKTVARQKIDAPLMREIYRRRGEAAAKRIPASAAGVRVDRHGRAYVAVHAPVTDPLKRKIVVLGGRIVSSSPQYQTVVALMPVTMVERLAADRSVRSVVSTSGTPR